MNEKSNRNLIIVVIFAVICIAAGFIGGSYFGRTDSDDNNGVESNIARERELLDRIGEYQQREEDRIRAEAGRIAAERARIERTENAIRAIRESDRRSGSLLQELEQEVNILADYFRDSRDIISNDADNSRSK